MQYLSSQPSTQAIIYLSVRSVESLSACTMERLFRSAQLGGFGFIGVNLFPTKSISSAAARHFRCAISGQECYRFINNGQSHSIQDAEHIKMRSRKICLTFLSVLMISLSCSATSISFCSLAVPSRCSGRVTDITSLLYLHASRSRAT